MTSLNLKFHPLFLLSIIFLLLSPTFFSPSHAEGDDDDTITSWKEQRSQFHENNSTFILAAERTRRIDPSNNFKYYEAGWDITNSHYFMSLVYSAAPVLFVAAVWFFAVILFFVIALCCFCCCCKNDKKRGYSRTIYWISLIFIVLFFLMAIVGGVLLYAGQGNFQRATNEVIDDLARRVTEIVDLLNSVLNNLDGATKLAVGAYSLPEEYEKNIEQFRDMVHSNSTTPKVVVEKIVREADNFLDALSYSLIVATAVMLVLAVLGFIISVCGWKVIVYFLLFIGWILVTATLILCFISFIVQNGVGDTCVAMEDWLQHPQNRTALSEVLPCVDGPTAQKALDITKNTSFQMVNLVNNFVNNVANADAPQQGRASVFYNQSGPSLPLLCNPFYPNMTERPCDPLEVHLDNASQVYQSFVCSTSPDGRCNTLGRLTPDLYQQMMMAANMSDILYRNGPPLIDLIDCTFVAETFDEISKHHCPAMRRYTSQIFIGLMLISLALMFSLILWVVFVRERQYQISSKNLRKP